MKKYIAGYAIALVLQASVASALAGCPTGACGAGARSGTKAQCTAGTEAQEATGAEQGEISASVLKALIDAGGPLTVLDARTGKYDDGRRVPGASSLSAAASEAEVAASIKSKTDLVVTYCSNLKCPASAALAKRLRALGYRNVLEFPAGIDGWEEAGNTVEKSKD